MYYIIVIVYIPTTITVPCVLLVDWTIHWKVVVELIDITVNENALGIEGLFNRYIWLLFIMSSLVNNVPLIIHWTCNSVSLSYPQLMVTFIPLQTAALLGGVRIVTTYEQKQVKHMEKITCCCTNHIGGTLKNHSTHVFVSFHKFNRHSVLKVFGETQNLPTYIFHHCFVLCTYIV